MNELPAREPPGRRCFDRGVVYFNQGAFFEAHEDWEHLWHGAEGSLRRRLQGMIQIAAAFVHFARGYHATGFVKLVDQGLDKLGSDPRNPWGADLARFRRDLGPWSRHAARVAAGAPLLEDAPGLPSLFYEAEVEPDPASPDEEVYDAG